MNRLTDTRDELHSRLEVAMEAGQWPAERATRFPPEQLVTPCAWVDAPRLNPVGAALGVTFTLCLVVDGVKQLEQVDDYLARLVTELRKPWVEDKSRRAFTLITAGPAEIELDSGGVTTGIVAVVQLELSPNTLCPEPLASSDTPD